MFTNYTYRSWQINWNGQHDDVRTSGESVHSVIIMSNGPNMASWTCYTISCSKAGRSF